MEKLILTSLSEDDFKASIEICLRKIFKENNFNSSLPPPDSPVLLYTVKDLSCLLKISVPTVRSLIKNKSIAHIKTGKLIYFKNEDVQAYLQTCRQKSHAEIDLEAKKYINNHKKKKRHV